MTEKAPQKSRKGLYYISDSFIRFWFAFVYPCKGDLEIDNLHLCRNGTINFSPSKVGAYWEGKSGNEIDLVAIDEEKKQILFGECKYYKSQPLDVKVYSALLEKSKIPLFSGYEHYFALFSVSGFDKRLAEIAAKNPNLFLINEGQLYLPQ